MSRRHSLIDPEILAAVDRLDELRTAYNQAHLQSDRARALAIRDEAAKYAAGLSPSLRASRYLRFVLRLTLAGMSQWDPEDPHGPRGLEKALVGAVIAIVRLQAAVRNRRRS